MNKRLSKFAIGELATVVRSAYTAGQNIVSSSALVVDVQQHSDKNLGRTGHRIERYRVLIDNELYNLYEHELQ